MSRFSPSSDGRPPLVGPQGGDDSPGASPRQGPVVIERGQDGGAADPATAAPVPETAPGAFTPEGRAMQAAMRLGAGGGARAGGGGLALGKIFLASAGALLSFLASVAAWRFVEGLIVSTPLLGYLALALFAAFVLAALALALRELAALSRLARLDRLQRAAAQALAGADLAGARAVSDRLSALYADRPECAWGRDRLAARAPEILDADALLRLTETELLAPLDQAARREVEAAARSVAAVTALVPLALADVAAALAANLRMVRRLAEIYGGRAGGLGSLRLMRAVLTHLVATGAVAVGDDLIETMAGGGLLSKLSRRFGEGVVNGALTARVGLAAMETCRPLPFAALPRPRVTGLVSRGLSGLFPGGPKAPAAPDAAGQHRREAGRESGREAGRETGREAGPGAD